nr:MerR family DNA-binding protein [Methylorubrum zatmanii]
MNAHPDRSCGDVDLIARRHLAEVDRRIERLWRFGANSTG